MRTPLEQGILIRMNASECYEVTGAPVGEGGGSLIYPAVRCVLRGGAYKREALEYAIKECFPASDSSRFVFQRSDQGEIVVERGGKEAEHYLLRVQRMQLGEQEVTNAVYKTGFRLTPILNAVTEAELSTDGGLHFQLIHNTFTVMESLSAKGRALRSYLTKPHRITLAQALRVTQQVLLALREVHSAGYLHLDIQDGNVFVRGGLEDGSDFASLIDFGSARKLLEDGKCAPIADRTLFSTPGFRAPEMIYHNDGTLRLGPEADLYSVGCLLLLLLTGQRRKSNELYAWKDRRHMLTRINLSRIKCPRHLVDQLQELVGKALENEPEQRYHCAEEMLSEVNALAMAVMPRHGELSGVHYDAFLCYSHGSRDSVLARRLQRGLELFHSPSLRTGERGGRRFRRVFLDEAELSSGEGYEEEIHAALHHSGWLIVLCSPRTPDSGRVRREIDWFLEKHERSRVLALLTEGEPEESFPPQLLGSVKQREILAADARGKSLQESLERLRKDCLLRLAATMLGTTYDTLKQRRLRQRRRELVVALTISAVVCAALATLFSLRMGERELKLAEYARNELEAGNPQEAIRLVLKGYDGMGEPSAPAQRVLADALGVYELGDGFQPAARLELPGQPLHLTLSPSGEVGAAVSTGKLIVFDAGDAQILASIPLDRSSMTQAVLPNDNIVLYGGEKGLSCSDLKTGQERWTGSPATAVCISADGTRTAGVYRDESFATVYDTASGAVVGKVDFRGRCQQVQWNDSFSDIGERVFALNRDGTVLAASFSDGSLMLFDVEDSESCTELMDSSSERRGYTGGFSGDFFAFSVTQQEQSAFCVVDTRTMEQTGGFQGDASYHVQTDEEGIFLQAENLVVKVDPVTGEQTPLVKAGEEVLHFARAGELTLTVFRNGASLYDGQGRIRSSWHFEEGCDYAALAGKSVVTGSLSASSVRLFRARSHREHQVVKYDSGYDHDEARISADGRTVMLFSKDGFQVLNRQGDVVAQRELPTPDQIYDQQYLREGVRSWLEVTWYDGTVVSYDGANGSECARTRSDAPNLDIVDQFETEKYRITSPLHGAPQVYDRKTGELYCELEGDAYLTYITQVEDGMVAQYMTADGAYYAQLLNQHCQVVATMPNLCDVWEDTLYFDCPAGEIRESKIYTAQELLAMGTEQLGGKSK